MNYVKEANRLHDQQCDIGPLDTEDKKSEWRRIQRQIDQLKKNQTIHSCRVMHHLDLQERS